VAKEVFFNEMQMSRANMIYLDILGLKMVLSYFAASEFPPEILRDPGLLN
jgi:hypothetical protein